MLNSYPYLPHFLAALWFVLCWGGYTRYASSKARTTPVWPASCICIVKTGCAACCCVTIALPTPT